jgi:metal-sulfur cluster biosynthetic enzyme
MADVGAAIVSTLSGVYDPCCVERGISIVDMGLVRTVEVGGGRARVELILTSGWCPFAARLVTEVKERVEAVPGVAQAKVEVVWDEPWTTARMSSEARTKLRFLPEPAAIPDRQAYVAARRRPSTAVSVEGEPYDR